ncbi:GRIP protein [Nymphaea thermarum]|nr:GRIP protein [Nymphaea thermarum]
MEGEVGMSTDAEGDEETCATGSSSEEEANHSSGEVPRNDGSAWIPEQDAISSLDGNGIDLPRDNGDHDHLVQTILELRFQNECFKTQIQDLQVHYLRGREDHVEHGAVENGEAVPFGDSTELREKVRILTQQIKEQKETQVAADDALKHLRSACDEADAKVAELSAKLMEAEKIKDREIRERDEKYSELDSKLGRLHKRAKQRIQELQKEKDDVEANLREVNEKAAQLSSQLALVQQELERNRQKASEALRSLDSERQQLRTTNNKLRDNLDELHRSVEAKETALEGVQQALAEKEQMLHDMQGLLQSMDEKRQASIVEISSKHQKQVESLEAQLADAIADRSKAAETISSLQAVIAEKESQIAELDAASSGEAARLGAALEAAKGEVLNLKNEHEKEKDNWEASILALKAKLEESENGCLRSEIESAKTRSELELQLAVLNQQLNAKDSELLAVKDEVSNLEKEFSSYKVRAHALLQKKEAELSAAKETQLIQALEAAVKEAETDLAAATLDRDRAYQDLNDFHSKHDEEINARDKALSIAEKKISDMEANLSAVRSLHLSEKEAWQQSLKNMEQTWRLKCEALEAQVNEASEKSLEKELESFKLQYKQLKEEHDSFRDIAEKMVDAKDKEIAKLLDEKDNLQRTMHARPQLLARQQALRDEQLAQSQRHILALQEEIEELEHENRLHSQQEAVLKAELRDMERKQKREGIDMTYLKNVILKLLETGEVEALLPVVATLLQFSPDEIKKLQDTYKAVAASADIASPGSRSLLSRFSFS